MKRPARLPVVVTAVIAALAVGAGGTLAVRELVATSDAPSVVPSAALTTESAEVTDDLGDADLTVGDIVSAGFTAAPDGTMTATVVVNEWTQPASDDWVSGETGARWPLDVDGDDNADGRVQLSVEGGVLRGGVFGPGGRVVCVGDPSSDQIARSYSVSFASTCIGNPEQLRFQTQFAYDDVVFDLQSLDAGPGWSSVIVNPAAVTTTTTTTTTTPPTTTTTPPVAPSDPAIVSLSPARLLETRSGQPDPTVDGLFAGGGVRGAGVVTAVRVTGRGGVPASASAVLLNATLVAQGSGFATLFPCGEDRPTASNVNYVAGAVVANAVLAKVGVGGEVCVYTHGAAHLVIDVNGYVPLGSDVVSLSPARLLETRSGQPDPTVDGLFAGGGVRGAGVVTAVRVTGRGGVPASASAVLLNATLVAQGSGFATLFPCGEDRPTASNVNYVAGAVVANAVLAKVGVGGEVCVYTHGAAHLVIDVNGYVPLGSDVVSLSPARLLETRPGQPDPTVDGLFAGGGVRGAGVVTAVRVTGRGGVPASASAVLLNATLVAQGSGFATLFPCGEDRPTASNVNYVAGAVVANAVLAKVGVGGEVCVYTHGAAHLVIDVNGYVP